MTGKMEKSLPRCSSGSAPSGWPEEAAPLRAPLVPEPPVEQPTCLCVTTTPRNKSTARARTHVLWAGLWRVQQSDSPGPSAGCFPGRAAHAPGRGGARARRTWRLEKRTQRVNAINAINVIDRRESRKTQSSVSSWFSAFRPRFFRLSRTGSDAGPCGAPGVERWARRRAC